MKERQSILKPSGSVPPGAASELVKPLVLDTRPIFARGEAPCKRIDIAIASLIPAQALVILASFEPVPLYAKLAKEGFSSEAKQLDPETWQVTFRKDQLLGSPRREESAGCPTAAM